MLLGGISIAVLNGSVEGIFKSETGWTIIASSGSSGQVSLYNLSR
jgi:hypothetical protein